MGNIIDNIYQKFAWSAAIITIAYTYWNSQWLALGYLIIINAFTMQLYYNDKFDSKKRRRWRTSENCLIWAGFFGGWIGAIFAQQWFRHKTRKLSFQLTFIASIVLNILMIYNKDYILDKIHEHFVGGNLSV